MVVAHVSRGQSVLDGFQLSSSEGDGHHRWQTWKVEVCVVSLFLLVGVIMGGTRKEEGEAAAVFGVVVWSWVCRCFLFFFCRLVAAVVAVPDPDA